MSRTTGAAATSHQTGTMIEAIVYLYLALLVPGVFLLGLMVLAELLVQKK